MKNLNNETPLSFLTIGEFKEILRTAERPAEAVQTLQTSDPDEYVHGYQGVRNLLKISHTKTWELLSTVLKPAKIMYGARKFMLHKQTVLKLLAEANQEKGNQQ